MGIFSLKSKIARALNKSQVNRNRHHDENQIKSFRVNQEAEKASASRVLGYRDVPLKQIVGSVGRYRDFDHRFRLKKNVPSQRLQSIKEAIRSGKPLPPVKLHKIKDEYYVLDGNHRVAAAKEFDWESIEAHIVEYLPSEETLGNILHREKSDFEWNTGLYDKVDLTEVGQYAYLLEQIHEHQISLGDMVGKTVSLKSAAKDWHQTIYLPFVAIIEHSRLSGAFPERTLSDFYAYISCHQWKKNRARKYGVGIDELIPKSMEKFRAKMAERKSLDPPEMTRLTTAFLLISVNARREKRIMEKLYAFREVQEVHYVPGEFDIIVKILVERDILSSDSEVVGEVLDKVRLIPGVIKTQTIIPIASRCKKGLDS